MIVVTWSRLYIHDLDLPMPTGRGNGGLTPHKVVRDLDRRAIPNEAKVVAVDVRFERSLRTVSMLAVGSNARYMSK